MEIIINHADQLVVQLKGRLDTVTSVDFTDAVNKEEIKEDVVVVDMKELEYISSAGLRLIVALNKDLTAKGKKLEIHNINQVCSEVFRVTGFNKLIIIK